MEFKDYRELKKGDIMGRNICFKCEYGGGALEYWAYYAETDLFKCSSQMNLDKAHICIKLNKKIGE
jgi:hypothetical protein